MKSVKDERRLLFLTYLLALVCFVDLGMLKGESFNQGFDYGALVIGGVMCILIAYSHFVIRKFFPDGDKHIFIFAAILCVIGIVMLYRLDMTNALLHQSDILNNVAKPRAATNFAIKQVIWFALGVAGYIALVVLLPDLKRFAKYKYVYMVLTLVFMAMSQLIGTEVYGAKNWVFFAGMSFQPSEFGKLFLVAYLASSLKGFEKFYHLIEPGLVVLTSLGLMVLQKDLGSALIIFIISLTMLYIATSKLRYVLTGLFLFIGGSILSYKIFDHVRLRVAIWKNPWADSYNKGHQLVQSLIAIASGGLFGVGLGKGFPEYIPVNNSDFIFAAICEDLGLLMGLALILLYFLLFYRCMRAAVYVNDKFSRLLAVGYSTLLASQAMVIIGGVVGAIPLTGITLPFVSYGGTSMLIMFFALAIVQKISEESI